jgi:uncharacterized protein (TIGR02271 family)
MSTTLVGIFDDYSSAQAAVQELSRMGLRHADISIAKHTHPEGYMTYGGPGSKDYSSGKSIGTKINEFFAGIFGSDIDEDERGLYAEAVRRGSTVVTVNVAESMLAKASDVMNKYGAVDPVRRVAQYKTTGYQRYDPQAPPYSPEQAAKEFQAYGTTGEIALPVIEESLQVGKRAVQRGGVRIVTRSTERPVEETVSLRTEQVHVERHPVDRAVSEADLAAVRDRSFDVTTTSEEAVVSKQARVVEEVVVGKEVTQHDETIRDTLRRTDVKVEKIEAPSSTAGKKTKQ